MRFLLIIGIAISAFLNIEAQNTVQFKVVDNNSQEVLIGVNIFLEELSLGTTTDFQGLAQLENIPSGSYTTSFSYIGYENYSFVIDVPSSDNMFLIELNTAASELDEVVVVSNRANRSIANIPSRIEVLTDEVEEAATMDPSKIAHLLMHTTGVQVQQTSATSGSANVRIQGQYGRYTQILKDGFPIYGGFTGGLGILQIPPLDLRQVEFVKGSSSTLYGGGAIAGLINLISKEPAEEDELSVHLNMSHIGNVDINSFYSKRSGKLGITVFASSNTNTHYDVDEDGFTDVPEVQKFNLNPKLVYYINGRTTVSLGATFTNELRTGGDVRIVEGAVPDETNNFFERNKSKQFTTQFKLDHKLDNGGSIQFKNSTNTFKRNIFLNAYAFGGAQRSTFSEVNYAIEQMDQNLILGVNFYTDSFEEEQLSNAFVRDQDLVTAGVFAQHIWDINRELSLESGFRFDYNTDYGSFPLPKIALIYKPGLKFVARLGGGFGYKLPSMFTEDAEALAFENILPLSVDNLEAETSYGLNGELTFRLVTTEEFSISLTEYLFFNRLNNPLILQGNPDGTFVFGNGLGRFETKGLETLIKASMHHFHLYLGYTYVDANLIEGNSEFVLPLTPQHSIHGDLMFVEDGKWRMGIDAEYESEQTLATGRVVRSLFKAGFLAERTIEQFSIYINLENWTDTRQTRYESLLFGGAENPRFTEVWAPLDGFIFNAGLKVRL